MKPLLLTFDLEEFDLPTERGIFIDPSAQIAISREGVLRILPVLTRNRVCATFFVTGRFAEAEPEIVRRLVEEGHEAAVHGLEHSDDYSNLPIETARQRLKLARDLVEKASGVAAVGMRTPHFTQCPTNLLHEIGFRYDASIHPTWIPGRYNELRRSRSPWVEDRLLRIPISVIPYVRAPVSFLWFRLMPRSIAASLVQLASFRAPYLHLYFHPWEAATIEGYEIPSWLAIGTGEHFVDSLDKLLRRITPKFPPMTLREFAEHSDFYRSCA